MADGKRQIGTTDAVVKIYYKPNKAKYVKKIVLYV